MSEFRTPLKENSSTSYAHQKNSAHTRQGDWVCLQCHNLNFSFRKKCNRCKMQTRQENQRLNAYYYQCNAYYYQNQKENFPSLQGSPSQQQPSSASVDLPITVDIKEHQKTPIKSNNGYELPSVSPLVKRYKCRGAESTQQSKRGGLFENESVWANIDQIYFEECHKENEQNRGDDQLDQIQKIIERIML